MQNKHTHIHANIFKIHSDRIKHARENFPPRNLEILAAPSSVRQPIFHQESLISRCFWPQHTHTSVWSGEP